MIKDLLLPEKIGSYYIFGKRVVGIEITKTHIYATVTYFQGSKITIEQCIEMLIEQHNGDSASVRIGAALKKVFSLVGSYQEIRLAISSSQIIFKTMLMPFNDIEKIKKVVDFEVEPLLPFSIADSIVDFIITKSNTAQHNSEIIIAAIQKQYITQHIEIFTQIGITPDIITIDLFELYGFYKLISSTQLGNNALIELSSDNTKIIFITDGQLRFIRTLPVGMETLKKSGEERNVYTPPKNDAPEIQASEPMNDGKALAENLLFTLQSFTSQLNISEPPRLFLLGEEANAPGLLSRLQQALNMPIELFNPNQVAEHTHITLKSVTQIPLANTISTAAALSSPTTEHINLRQKEFAPKDEQLLIKQLACGLLLLVLIFASLLAHSFLQKRTLRNELTSSKTETAEMIGQWFPAIDKGPIDDMLEEAETETKKDERIWFAFARSASNSLLNILLELTKLNREGLGLAVDKITIDQERGIMYLKASVKDHDALARLENELKQSNLFSYVQPQNDINFNMELRFAGEREGES
jgi:type IV pilus assembly protein PilM